MSDWSKQRVRDNELRVQRERLQDREHKLALQRDREREREADRRDRKRHRQASGSGGSSLGWILAIVLVAVIAWALGASRGENSRRAPETTEDIEVQPNVGANEPSSGSATVQSDQPARPVAEKQEATDPKHVTDASPAQVEIPAQSTAIRAAFESGQTERWEADGLKGYAVPSELVAGCRNIAVTLDSDERASRVVKLCE